MSVMALNRLAHATKSLGVLVFSGVLGVSVSGRFFVGFDGGGSLHSDAV